MVIASIDLMNGKAVQLVQGRDKVLEKDDPLALAQEFNRCGEIAVIDLDAAMGKGENGEIIRQICRVAECRVGGGIRDTDRARKIMSWGARKIIIGTQAFAGNKINGKFLEEMKQAVGRERLIVAIDALNGNIVTQGWTHPTGIRVLDVIGELGQYAGEFLFTCVEKEGRMGGTDMDTIKKIRAAAPSLLTAAGGIHTLEQIRELADWRVDVQLGMALYTNKITLNDGFAASINWKNDLIPVIATDESGQVLMLAYANREAVGKTLATGKMWYYSRSRQKLWMKGEESGHEQQLVKLRLDCDRDAILATVRQTDVACHNLTYSCFGDRNFSLDELYDVVANRFRNPFPGSYTATLTAVKVREKIMEEAEEVCEAKNKQDIIWEAADVLYFVTVLLQKEGVTFADVLHELRRRRWK